MWGIEHSIAMGALVCNVILTALALWRACQTKGILDNHLEDLSKQGSPSSSCDQSPAHTASRRR